MNNFPSIFSGTEVSRSLYNALTLHSPFFKEKYYIQPLLQYLTFLERTTKGSEITSGSFPNILGYNPSILVNLNIVGFFMPSPTHPLLILGADHTVCCGVRRVGYLPAAGS